MVYKMKKYIQKGYSELARLVLKYFFSSFLLYKKGITLIICVSPTLNARKK